ncbi:glucan phosphoethanolaminetransferase (alkaline phosphatase superfamily) [Paenibacillus endophyticus]|uniref:Glucan phosphoethanolaminetransferase (Alkaline phosphatase superfamily) n=1 Tax=Paenibacillus endophyticus TaxID=1294268 RepID=A0A7W5CEP6_9BACL|nr:glucan phosphoethanolaminetransferase (alkaline phosphatase superfamily) [Paenibacillus endophyticus]
MRITFIVILFFALVFYELPVLISEKRKAEAIAFITLMLFAFLLCVIRQTSIETPNPLDWILHLYKPLNDIFGVR